MVFYWGEVKVMAYLGITIGGFVLLGLISQILYQTIFKCMNPVARCQFSVIVAYVLASLGYGYNSINWGMTFGNGVVSGLINYALAAILCFVVYFFLSKPKENNRV